MSSFTKTILRTLLVALLMVNSLVASVTILSPSSSTVGTAPFQITYRVNKETSYGNWYSPNPVPTFTLINGVGTVTSSGLVTPNGSTGFLTIRVRLPSYQYRVPHVRFKYTTQTEPAWEGVFTFMVVQNTSVPASVFTFTGSTQNVTVPANVNKAHIIAVGGAGGGSGWTEYLGGEGGTLEAIVTVVPGEALEINVGGGGRSNASSQGNGTSGSGGGSSSVFGQKFRLWAGGGGGATGDLYAEDGPFGLRGGGDGGRGVSVGQAGPGGGGAGGDFVTGTSQGGRSGTGVQAGGWPDGGAAASGTSRSYTGGGGGGGFRGGRAGKDGSYGGGGGSSYVYNYNGGINPVVGTSRTRGQLAGAGLGFASTVGSTNGTSVYPGAVRIAWLFNEPPPDPPQPPIPVNGIVYNGLGLPADGYVEQVLNFTANISNSGTKNFGPNHYITLRAEGSSTDLWLASLNGIVVGQSASVPFTLTLPAAPGTYTYTFNAFENGVEWFGGTQSDTIIVTRRPYTVTVTVVGGGMVTGAGSFYDGDTCVLTPIPNDGTYFMGFTGDQVGPGATLTDPSPEISFEVNGDTNVTATFTGKLPQLVTLDNPGTKPSNAPPFTLRWTTNAGTDPTGSIVSGPATINPSEQVTLGGTEGVVTARLEFPGTVFYQPASIETTFTVGPPVAGTVVDSMGASTILTAAIPAENLVGNVSSDTLTPFVNSSAEARDTIALSRMQVAGLYNPNNPGGGTSTGGGDTGGGTTNPPTVTTLPPSGTSGQQVTYQGFIYTWTFNPQTSTFSWVKGSAAR